MLSTTGLLAAAWTWLGPLRGRTAWSFAIAQGALVPERGHPIARLRGSCSPRVAGSYQVQRKLAWRDERLYLGLQQQLDLGESPARTLADLWEHDWRHDVGRLVEFARYRI